MKIRYIHKSCVNETNLHMKHFETLNMRQSFEIGMTGMPPVGGGREGGGGVALPKILVRGVPHGSQNPDPISDQTILFSIPIFRPLEVA